MLSEPPESSVHSERWHWDLNACVYGVLTNSFLLPPSLALQGRVVEARWAGRASGVQTGVAVESWAVCWSVESIA